MRALLGGHLLSYGWRVLPPDPLPSQLLRAEYRAVPFDQAREADLAWLLDWCGGVGKTRIALELAATLRLEGWHAGILDKEADGAPAWTLRELLAERSDLLIVVDYAETRRPVLETLLRQAQLDPVGRRVRLLLLARAVADWWDDLRTRDPEVRELLDREDRAALTRSIAPLFQEPKDQCRIFHGAASAFARRLNCEVPANLAAPKLSPETASLPLYQHMAALAALQGGQLRIADELLDYVLDREESGWRKALTDLQLPGRLFRAVSQAAALLTLAGSVERDAAAVLLRRLPLLADLPREMLDAVVELLARLYPGSDDQTIAGVRPDVLGEQLVDRQLRRDDQLLDSIFAAPTA